MLKAGFARVDVTPPLGSDVAGYFTKRISDGVLDPLELNAIALQEGEKTVLLVATDFIYIMENVATEMRLLIEKELGVSRHCVLLHGLHQHTSVRIGHKPHLTSKPAMDDPHYMALLYRKMVDVCRMAMDDMEEAELWNGAGETAVPISFIRRYRMKDGSLRTNPGVGNPDVVEPVGEADQTVRFLRFRRAKGDIALVNFSTHPDVIGGNKYSADWPGFVRRKTEAALPGVRCAVFNGAQGDSNHINVFGERKGKGYGHSEYMGQVITDALLKIWDQAKPCQTNGLWGRVEMVYVPTNVQGMDEIEKYRALREEYNAGKIKLIGAELAQMGRVCSLYEEKLYQKVPVTVMGVGEVALVGYGGEPFTHYATASREAAPELFVITCCCTNGGQGYLPDESAYQDGGYEVCNSRFDSSVAGRLQGKAKELLDAYQATRS